MGYQEEVDEDQRHGKSDRRLAPRFFLLVGHTGPLITIPRRQTIGSNRLKASNALARAVPRRSPDNVELADRFEVYFGALELANGYVELTDADELARRIEVDLCTRRERGLAEVGSDKELLAAHVEGLPDCAGVALGFERLHMIDANVDDIRNVVSFT